MNSIGWEGQGASRVCNMAQLQEAIMVYFQVWLNKYFTQKSLLDTFNGNPFGVFGLCFLDSLKNFIRYY